MGCGDEKGVNDKSKPKESVLKVQDYHDIEHVIQENGEVESDNAEIASVEPTPVNQIMSEEYFDKIAKDEHQRFQEQKKHLPNLNIVAMPIQIDDMNHRVKKLKSDDIVWLKNLFEGKSKTVPYRRFSSIWINLCGPKSIVPSKKGSSHFALLNPEGSIIGGIFTHGIGQEYWGKAVSDIREHFMAIGITKECFPN